MVLFVPSLKEASDIGILEDFNGLSVESLHQKQSFSGNCFAFVGVSRDRKRKTSHSFNNNHTNLNGQ